MKAPHNEELPYSYCKLVEVSLKGSFADAEMGKDVLEDVFGGDFADYVGEVVDAFADVLA